MANCAACGGSLWLNAVKKHGMQFCSDTCYQQNFLLPVAQQVPPEVIARHTIEMHQGMCPRCGGPGPVDLHTSYRIWSALVLTSWHTRPQVCCHRCGFKSKLTGALMSGIAGWWGFPWGLIMTPVQIVRNVVAMFSSPDPMQPSPQLENFVKMSLAAYLVDADRESADGSATEATVVD